MKKRTKNEKNVFFCVFSKKRTYQSYSFFLQKVMVFAVFTKNISHSKIWTTNERIDKNVQKTQKNTKKWGFPTSINGFWREIYSWILGTSQRFAVKKKTYTSRLISPDFSHLILQGNSKLNIFVHISTVNVCLKQKIRWWFLQWPNEHLSKNELLQQKHKISLWDR